MDYGEMARMMSNATGMDLENAYHKVIGSSFMANVRTIRNVHDLDGALNKSPLQPIPKSCLPGVSAKEFVDMAAKTFGMDRSAALDTFARETGRDLESVVHEVSCPDLKPINGVPSSPFPLGTLSASRAPCGTWHLERMSGYCKADNQSNLAKVNDSDLKTSERESALRELIESQALEELHDLLNNTDRGNSWRQKALDALCDTARRGSSLAIDLLNRVVNNTDRGNSWRQQALDSLCEAANVSPEAVDILYGIFNNTDRGNSWREQALRAVIRLERLDLFEKIINNTDRGNSWREEVVVALCNMANRSSEAADCLYRLVNNTDRGESWRHMALRALIDGGCRDHLRRIAQNTDRCANWRREAREALGGE